MFLPPLDLGAVMYLLTPTRRVGSDYLPGVLAMVPKVIHWDPQWGPLAEDAMQHRLTAEGYGVSRYRYKVGTRYPMHAHGMDKIETVLSGRLKIAWDADAAVLEAGDMIAIPAGVRHSAEVVGMEAVVSLDATRKAARDAASAAAI